MEQYNETSNKDKKKTKSYNPLFSTNQPQILAYNSKKCQRKGQRGVYLATKVNVTKVSKKNKDKAKDLSHVKYYICKQKDYYTNKCFDKQKN